MTSIFPVTKQNIFKIVITIWVILWAFFLIREDKEGQYRLLRGLYLEKPEGRTRLVYGGDLYDFLVFCRGCIPSGYTYQITGFEKYSIDEMRARYFLYPAISVGNNPDFKIIYGRDIPAPDGYREFKRYPGEVSGKLFIRKGLEI